MNRKTRMQKALLSLPWNDLDQRSVRRRWILAATSFLLALSTSSFAANPTQGTLNPGSTAALQWDGTAVGAPSGTGETACQDDWQSSPDAAAIQATTIPPTNPKESAILRTLAPGAYTAVMRDANGGTGIGLVEIYNLGNQ